MFFGDFFCESLSKSAFAKSINSPQDSLGIFITDFRACFHKSFEPIYPSIRST